MGPIPWPNMAVGTPSGHRRPDQLQELQPVIEERIGRAAATAHHKRVRAEQPPQELAHVLVCRLPREQLGAHRQPGRARARTPYRSGEALGTLALRSWQDRPVRPAGPRVPEPAGLAGRRHGRHVRTVPLQQLGCAGHDTNRGLRPASAQALHAHLEHRHIPEVEQGVAAGLHEEPRTAAALPGKARRGYLANLCKLAAGARPNLTARSRGARVSNHEGAEHRVLPELVPARVIAHPAGRLRPPIAGEPPVHVGEPPAGARELQVKVVVLALPQPAGIAADGPDRERARRDRGRGHRVLLGDLREIVHRVDRRIADVVLVATRMAEDRAVRVRKPDRRIVETGQYGAEVVRLPQVVRVQLGDERRPRCREGGHASGRQTAIPLVPDDP